MSRNRTRKMEWNLIRYSSVLYCNQINQEPQNQLEQLSEKLSEKEASLDSAKLQMTAVSAENESLVERIARLKKTIRYQKAGLSRYLLYIRRLYDLAQGTSTEKRISTRDSPKSTRKTTQKRCSRQSTR